MSKKSEHSDSDSNNSSSWIIVDEEEKDEKEADDEEEDEDEDVTETRKTIEELQDLDDSDGISIISDPEEGHAEWLADATAEPSEPPLDYKNTQIAKIEARPAPITSSLTSAGFMIVGILVALYFQSGLDDEVLENTTAKYSANDLMYKSNHFKEIAKDVKYEGDYGRQNKFAEPGDYHKQKQYDSKGDGKKSYRSATDDDKEYIRHKDEKYNKGNSIKEKYQKTYKNKWDSSEERRGAYIKRDLHEDSKNKKGNRMRDQDESLVKTQHYSKQKDDRVKQKALKMQSGENSNKGEWYESLHKGRNNRRSEEHRGDWIFDRANMRKTKRDKAHWYFNWMDDRENVRVKKTIM